MIVGASYSGSIHQVDLYGMANLKSTSLKGLFFDLSFGLAHGTIWTKPSLGNAAGRSLMELIRGFRCGLNLKHCSTSKVLFLVILNLHQTTAKIFITINLTPHLKGMKQRHDRGEDFRVAEELFSN